MQRSVPSSGLNIFNGVPMAIPTVQLLADRSLEQKQAFITAVTKAACLTPGSSPGSGHIIIQDVKRDDWATGAKPWSDQG
jgi:4-oxalocrotonate tautomerase